MNKNDPAKNRPRLGRGLSSLISMTDDMDVQEPAAARPAMPTEFESVPQTMPSANLLVDSSAISSTGISSEAVMRSVDLSHEIQPSPPSQVLRGTPLDVSVDAVAPNPSQPRKYFDEQSLLELAESIKANGVIQPIVVRDLGQGKYELIAGERRLRASKLAGRATIPAVVREADRLTQSQLALVENIQRQDLNPLERGQAYRTLLTELGLTQTELAQRLGEERVSITNYMRLLELPEFTRQLIAQGLLTLSHAKIIAGIKDSAEQDRLAKLVVSQQLSLKNLERIIGQPAEVGVKSSENGKLESGKPASAHLRELELTLTRSLGLRARVQASTQGNRGKVIVHYTNLDEFDALIAKLGVTLES